MSVKINLEICEAPRMVTHRRSAIEGECCSRRGAAMASSANGGRQRSGHSAEALPTLEQIAWLPEPAW